MLGGLWIRKHIVWCWRQDIWVRLITLALSFLYGEKRGVLSHYIYIYKRERGEGIGERARRKEIESS